MFLNMLCRDFDQGRMAQPKAPEQTKISVSFRAYTLKFFVYGRKDRDRYA